MLERLTVHDFAIVAELELEFGPGMTVLTGETGAGKSILIDALGLALGERASSSCIRAGCDRTDVSAVFQIVDLPGVNDWLDAQDLGARGDCIVRRSLARDGRSRAYINGRVVPVGTLRELGDQLVEIHGQHAHQSLLHRDAQRNLLDDFAGHGKELEQLLGLYRAWTAASRELEKLRGPADDREARVALLRYQLEEIDRLEPQAGELDRLQEEYRRLAHVNELTGRGQTVLQHMVEDEQSGLITRLQNCLTSIGDLARHDDRLQVVHDLLEGASIHIKEAASELRDYVDRLEPDPERLAQIDGRLASLHDLARKHHILPHQLSERAAELTDELEGLQNCDSRITALETTISATETEYRSAAEGLHNSRVSAAAKLSGNVSARLRKLGMPECEVTVAVEWADSSRLSASGLDQVQLLVRTNRGQPALPLAQIASGGELSRISLALQVVTAKGTGVPTVIFDEVDAGIGGRVAEIVGQQLRAVGQGRQVFCVTHLPQVAAQAHHHVRVEKVTRKKGVSSRFQPLLGDERVAEIARMLGGVKVTTQSKAHAREMLGRT